MHNSSLSKQSDDVHLTLRSETSKSFEVPENRLSKEPGQKGLSMEPAQDNSPKQHQQKRSSNETDEAKSFKEDTMKKHQHILILEIPDRIMN